MGTGMERSKTLHNFRMPGDLRWGNQRFLRCMKVNSDGRISPLRRSAADSSWNSDQRYRRDFVQPPRSGRDRERGRETDSSSEESLHGSLKVGVTLPAPTGVCRRFSEDDCGIAATREKLMFDLQTAADKMKDAIFKDGLKQGEAASPPPPVVASIDGDMNRPWNLRTRRAACKIPASRFVSFATAEGLTVDLAKSNSVFPQSQTAPRLRNGESTATATVGEKRERAKLKVALSKSEIEEDFWKLVGHRPARRPKKRAKIVQRQLDTLFPGLWLTEVTPDMYKVNEAGQDG